MDFFATILPYLSAILTGVVGWFAGRKKQNNDFLKELQESVNMLAAKNKELLKELVEVRCENAALLRNQTEMKVEMEALRKQNSQFQEEIEMLNKKLENVKTITRKG